MQEKCNADFHATLLSVKEAAGLERLRCEAVTRIHAFITVAVTLQIISVIQRKHMMLRYQWCTAGGAFVDVPVALSAVNVIGQVQAVNHCGKQKLTYICLENRQ